MTPFPLAWPEGMPRHKGIRETGQFRTSLSVALDNAKKSLSAFGRDSGAAVSNVVFSSNVGGLDTKITDPGVALWFTWDGATRCIAVDRYSKVEANLQAIHHILEADRTKLRHGSLEIVRASYRGFIALPASRRDWRAILGITPEARPTAAAIESQFRALAKQRHPDAGGTAEQMAELNHARAEALKEIGQ